VVCGCDIRMRPRAARRRIGYLPEGAPAYPDMTAGGFLAFIAHIRGMHGAAARKRVADVAELTGIAGVLHHPIERLPRGYRRRIGLAQAVLHDPAVAILDEPTDGLDINDTYEIRRIIRALPRSTAIVVSTRSVEDVETMCSRAIIMAHGRILADGTPAELAGRSRFHNAVRVAVPADADPEIGAELSHLPGVRTIEPVSDADGEGWWLFPWRSRPIIGEVAELVRARGWPVTCLRSERGRLEAVFRGMTMPPEAAAREPLRDAA